MAGRYEPREAVTRGGLHGRRHHRAGGAARVARAAPWGARGRAHCGALGLLLCLFLSQSLGACAHPTRGAHPAVAEATSIGLTENADGTWRIVGFSRTTPEAAMQDALQRANAAARQRGELMSPLRIEPHAAEGPGGSAEFACAVVFELRPDPRRSGPDAADHSFSAFEHRMRLLVEQHVLTIEEYTRLVAGHPGNPRTAVAPR